MEQTGEERNRPGNGHLFWGVVFVVIGILALLRRSIIVAGIPLWAISFLGIGISNLLKAPRVLDILRVSPGARSRLNTAANMINIAAIAGIAVSLIEEFFLS